MHPDRSSADRLLSVAPELLGGVAHACVAAIAAFSVFHLFFAAFNDWNDVALFQLEALYLVGLALALIFLRTDLLSLIAATNNPRVGYGAIITGSMLSFVLYFFVLSDARSIISLVFLIVPFMHFMIRMPPTSNVFVGVLLGSFAGALFFLDGFSVELENL